MMNPNLRTLLPFSLMTFKTKEDRDDAMRILQEYPMVGMFGTRIYGARNVPRYQREGGGMLRFMMKAMELTTPGLHFSHKLWDMDAVMIEGKWAGAVLPGVTDERIKALAVHPQFFKATEMGKVATDLWTSYGNFDKKYYTPATSSSTSSAAVMAPPARVYYIQDHYEFV
eukprot:1868416-Alexandrium_andersonii.AAC.1